MDPASRLTTLFITVAWLPFLSAPALAFPVFAAGAVLLLGAPGLRRQVSTGLWRVRWLLVALVILYGLFTPGQAPWLEALVRVGALACIVVAVQAALYGLSPAEVAAGLDRMLAPVGRTGIPTEAFARRLALTLDAVPRVQAMIAATPVPAAGRPLDRLADRAAAVFAAIEADHGTVGATVRVATDGSSPPVGATVRVATAWFFPALSIATGITLIALFGAR